MEQWSGCICCITTTSLALAPSCPLPACRCIRLCLSRWFDWPQLPIDRKNDGGTRCLALCIYSFPHYTCNPLRFYIAVTHTLIYPLSPSSSRLASLLGIAASLRRVCVCVAYDSPAIEQLLAKICAPSRVLLHPSAYCTKSRKAKIYEQYVVLRTSRVASATAAGFMGTACTSVALGYKLRCSTRRYQCFRIAI
jgi:hypothetical protein